MAAAVWENASSFTGEVQNENQAEPDGEARAKQGADDTRRAADCRVLVQAP
jgi:hypothetical protein